MKITENSPKYVEVELSRRNLEALLWALAARPGDAVLSRHDISEGVGLRIRAVEDDVHYGDRTPGWMPTDTERFDGPIQAPSPELRAAFNEAMGG